MTVVQREDWASTGSPSLPGTAATAAGLGTGLLVLIARVRCALAVAICSL